MTNRTKKFSYYALIGFVILILINVLLAFVPEDTTGTLRKVLGIINWLIFIPVFIVTLFFSVWVLVDYMRNNFKPPIKYFLQILPFLIYFIIYLGMFIYAVFIKQY
jgi:formate hydrogenlyase subunit 3/multisubunit Na+/H+ antiporter MnhD subunit